MIELNYKGAGTWRYWNEGDPESLYEVENKCGVWEFVKTGGAVFVTNKKLGWTRRWDNFDDAVRWLVWFTVKNKWRCN